MSFWRTYYHVVWATEDRRPLITPANEALLHRYIMQKVAELGIYLYAIGNDVDHVHVVWAVPPRLAVAHAIKHVKGATSHYMKVEAGEASFAWQRGYGIMSLGETQRTKAVDYVLRHKELHAQGTTNAWLERVAIIDEGPPDRGILVSDEFSALYEEPPVYDILGPAPF